MAQLKLNYDSNKKRWITSDGKVLPAGYQAYDSQRKTIVQYNTDGTVTAVKSPDYTHRVSYGFGDDISELSDGINAAQGRETSKGSITNSQVKNLLGTELELLTAPASASSSALINMPANTYIAANSIARLLGKDGLQKTIRLANDPNALKSDVIMSAVGDVFDASMLAIPGYSKLIRKGLKNKNLKNDIEKIKEEIRIQKQKEYEDSMNEMYREPDEIEELIDFSKKTHNTQIGKTRRGKVFYMEENPNNFIEK